jgi:ParB family chromosome partitioning protein
VIEGLAANIKTDGVLQNLVVSPVKAKGKSPHYQIVSGARRFHALKLLEDRGELPEDFTVAVEVRDDLIRARNMLLLPWPPTRVSGNGMTARGMT